MVHVSPEQLALDSVLCLYQPPLSNILFSFFPFPQIYRTTKQASQIKQLLQLRDRILRAGNGVPNGAAVGEDLVVVAALKRLVAKEVDCRVLDGLAAGPLGLVREVLQAVGLVPAGWEDVEGDLAADGEAVRSRC